MMLWLDDERDPKNFSEREGWLWVRTAPECIALLRANAGSVTVLSLDHDLAADEVPGAGEGIDVAKWLEEQAFVGDPSTLPDEVNIHSANSVGVKNMQAAIDAARRAITRR